MSDTSAGFGRVLVAVYALFALAAASRSTYQLLTRFDEAPLAYLLSALAGAMYIVATLALARGSVTIAFVAIGFELIGVLVVGLLTVVDRDLFHDATVWSNFGQGYGFVPLVLPLIGLWWLRRVTR